MEACSKNAQFLANVILIYISIPQYMELYTFLANILSIVLTLGTAHRVVDAARDIMRRVFLDPLFPEHLPANTKLALEELGPRDGFIVMVATAQESRRFYVAHAALCLAMTKLLPYDDPLWRTETFIKEKDYFYNTPIQGIRNKLYRIRAMQRISEETTRLNLVKQIKHRHPDRVRARIIRDERRKRLYKLGTNASTIDIELEKDYMMEIEARRARYSS